MKTAYQILIVEDNDIAQRMTAMMFKSQGADVWLAPTAKEALLMANTQRFSLIIMDIGLPDGCGLEISEHIRNNPGSLNHQTPIIVVTAHYDTVENKKHCQEIGINEVIQKPLFTEKIESLMAMLEPYGHLPLYDEKKAISLHRDKATANKVLTLYIQELSKAIIQFDNLYEAQDWKGLRTAIHREHGAGLYCGTIRLNACLNDMENILLKSPIDTPFLDCNYAQLQQILKEVLSLTQEKY